MTTVREATFDVLRACGMVDIFSNPGSTEVPFLVDLPSDFRFRLALHEGSVVGMATGFAIATERPAFVLLHTTAGLGNAVGALATARVNRAPLVVVVGQQDRRHLALEPFLTGHLTALAGPYPVWTSEPALPQDVPSAIRRACHEAAYGRGPAIVIVPRDDWDDPVADDLGLAAPLEVRRPPAIDHASVAEIASLLADSRSPAIVAGAGADTPATWTALTELVERLGCPVWQEAFGARAGFPQDHPLFAGQLPAGRVRLRETLAPYDVVLVIGTGAFRQYPFEPGPLVRSGAIVVVVADEAAAVHRSSATLGVVADPSLVCGRLVELVSRRETSRHTSRTIPPVPEGPFSARHVFAALAEQLPEDAVLVEETPSTRPLLHQYVPARAPRGFVSAAMGGLGFALPAAAGLRLGDPTRPVVAVVGDGSSMYGIQALWSAAKYGCGVLYLVLSNGGYAVMDLLAARQGGKPAWPGFDVDLRAMAEALGCPARLITDETTLRATFDEVLPGLADRREPLVLDVRVTPEEHFEP
ncbi:thiamine pyrophosphate-dependent enzyme [Tenggerimyces flavus]|uniref:Thiamine pyrophosphate-dependent enzyme n=1 Tax=Tenggerimyces flavus TaxID=1708749 RepID=A0ABV7YHH6_9ACTN|nr:thiamine pyrophosphate-dependent enzyme [Tenggerimyces flavus]MBM7784173.1 benzoylformate decarboxylase [Tenggerimyces flavus]